MIKTSYEIEEEIKDEGQLAVDIFEIEYKNTKKSTAAKNSASAIEGEIIILAPIAGVREKDIKITISEEVLVIQGKRDLEETLDTLELKDQEKNQRNYHTQECFFGNFSRSIILPKNCEQSKISAKYKNGILKIRIPLINKEKPQIVKIQK